MDEEDGRSVTTTSDCSDATRTTKRRRKSSISNSHYHFAYAAPTQRQKTRILQIRPEKLLQLQYIPQGSRPVPVLDVLPSAVIVPRLFQKFPRMFRGKAELGVNDVMVVRSESYGITEEESGGGSDSDEESFANRELLAVICQARKDAGKSLGKAEIVLADGSAWTATPILKDSFEFTKTDDSGVQVTARWSKRTGKGKRLDFLEPLDQIHEQVHTFSLIDPSTRRHPIIATLSPNNLRVNDYYLPVLPTSVTSTPPSPTRSPEPGSTASLPPSLDRSPIFVDEALKTFIEVTAIWVGLRKGWCSYFKYDDSMNTPSSTMRSRVASGAPGPNLSISVAENGPASPLSRSGTPELIRSPLAAVGDKVRRSCTTASTPTASSPKVSIAAPQRTVSTGSAFMQRNAARRGYSYPSISNTSEDDLSPAVWQRAGAELNVSFAAPTASLTNSQTPNGSLRRHPDITTKSQRRPHSTIGTMNGSREVKNPQDTHNIDSPLSKVVPESSKKQKISRWKKFTGLFKRNP